MKKFILILFVLMASLLHSQDLINNTGNRLQTYPRVTKANPEIQMMIDRVSIPNLKNAIQWMQDLGCRSAQSDMALQTHDWLMDQFQSFGLETYTHRFVCMYSYYSDCSPISCDGDTLEAGNVFAIQRGTEFPDEYIVISSHYDQPSCPGADDNASGTAGVVEIARILSQYQFKRSIMYTSFNAEEYGMVGSIAFVEACAERNMNILGCFNLDMLGFFPEDISPLTMYSGSSKISDRLFDYYQTVANIYVKNIPTLRFTKGDSYGGDHQSFNVYEYPGIYIGDVEYFRGYNPCIHKLCDTLGTGVNSLELAKGFVSATLAAVAELANGWLAPQQLSVISSGTKLKISWNAAQKTSKYRLFKNNAFLTEIIDTVYWDDNVVNGSNYVYYVTAIHAESGEESPSSNRDSITLTQPLELPYFNDFENNAADFFCNNSDWKPTALQAQSGQKSFTNINTASGEVCDNVLTIAELRYFCIPDTTKNITLSFWYQGILDEFWLETVGCVEISTDRKRWNKLVEFPRNHSNWSYIQVPLNQYIGNDFVQLRFRIESSGESTHERKRQIFIDNLKIDFNPLQPLSAPQNAQVSSYSPNTHTATIQWNGTSNYVSAYNVYKNKNKIASIPYYPTSYTDPNVLSITDCYQITAVYPAGESDFSNDACVANADIDENSNLHDIKIHPNPSQGFFEISTGLESPYHIIVYDLQGIMIFEKTDFRDGTLNLQFLSKGFYFLKIITDKNAVTKKIVIQ